MNEMSFISFQLVRLHHERRSHNAVRVVLILVGTLLPFLREVFPTGHRFMQDNDPKHTSRLAVKTMEDNGINWWKTPPESPDANPIENFWHKLKSHLRNTVKPRNVNELQLGIEQFWATVTPQKCCRYIDHLKKVLPVIVEKKGQASGY